MKAAIELEYPGTVHRNCLFHIFSKAEVYCGPTFNKIGGFAMNFYDIVYNLLTIEEFESLWKYMIEKHKVQRLSFQQIVEATEMYMVDEVEKNKVYIMNKSKEYTEKEI
ncbi:hypothetical protein C2845_PM13G08840 [Panicum miliaceum]|uniref:Protein FAR1-RELATED SEQUENCE n=1 Tax=Panicum miliaceum TaxID=4540 RepID=A0A3L6RHT0_PANMI|nr:hypothetical protein C2845_PM13G08840 [Panicum miliaceum]